VLKRDKAIKPLFRELGAVAYDQRILSWKGHGRVSILTLGLHSWSFRRLRTFITYKAALAGVPVRLVDPRNTSRTCHKCGHCDKRNRPTRDDFRGVRCGFAGPADHNPAINLGRRAAVSQPYAT
jgi:transposase